MKRMVSFARNSLASSIVFTVRFFFTTPSIDPRISIRGFNDISAFHSQNSGKTSMQTEIEKLVLSVDGPRT